jgi:DNA replication protein DnaC
MNNVNYEDILSQLNRKRQDNIRIQDNRKAEIYEKLPRVKEIDDALAHSAAERARARIRKIPFDQEEAEANASALKEEKLRLMASLGYDSSYLGPVYSCEKCRDTGYVSGAPCSCLKQMVISQLYQQSGIEKWLEIENFSTFRLDYYKDEKVDGHKYTPRENISSILKVLHEFIDDFPAKSPGIFLYGDVGLGKSFLTNCVCKELLDKGYTVLYLSAVNLFDNILPDIIIKNDNTPQQKLIHEYIYNCDFLVIDDLGTEYTNSFVLSQLFEIINSRTIKSQSTLISTNLDLDRFRTRYTERIMSRIVDSYKIFNLYGDNIRYVKQFKRLRGKTN